jgi:predicted transposase/invertase (TIGR01784 family)
MARKIIHFDWALKKLLRQKANYEILEGLLSVLLKQDIAIQNILESEGNKENESDKYNRVDIFAITSEDELIIIELQVDNEVDYFQRMAYGTSKAITEYMSAGNAYKNVKKVYSVNIVYFDLGQGSDYVYHGKTEFIGLHNHDILQLSENQMKAMPHRKVADIFPEYYVLKVNDFNGIAIDSLDEWIYVLKNSVVEDSFKARGLEKVKEILQIENMSEAEKANYKAYLDNLSNAKSTLYTAKLEGRLEGLLEGEQTKAYKIALKALRKGLAVNDISEMTDLSLNIIQKLKTLLARFGNNAEDYLHEL